MVYHYYNAKSTSSFICTFDYSFINAWTVEVSSS